MTAREVLDGIKARLTKATPGPWVYDKVSGVETVPEFDLHRFDIMPETIARIDLRHEDGEFIAASRTDVARLTRAVEAVEKILDQPAEMWAAICKETCGKDILGVDHETIAEDIATRIRAAIEDALNPKEGHIPGASAAECPCEECRDCAATFAPGWKESQ